MFYPLGTDPAALLARAGIDPTKRAEEIDVAGFVALANAPYATRQPYAEMSACAIGGNSMEPSPEPAMTAANARPRSRSNHALTTRA